MAALSFKARFVDKVEAGLRGEPDGKRQSIRAFRKNGPIKEGERLVLYYAQRTKYRRRLGETKNKSTQVVRLARSRVTVYDMLPNDKLKMAFSLNTKWELDAFAKADGFNDWEDMKAFWFEEHGVNCFPFSGNLYKW